MSSKAFFSHSSADKDIVRPTFELLGAGLAHYDERTFEPDSTSAEVILDGLMNSQVFVYFFSEHAIGSNWVSRELTYAQHLFFNGTIKKVIVIPLSEISRQKLPVWMSPFVVQQLLNPKFIAARIRSALQELDASEQPAADLFLGRDAELAYLKSDLTRSDQPRVTSLFISGIDGIGRRKLLQRAYADVFPFLPRVHIEIELQRFEGEVEFYDKLLTVSSPLRDAGNGFPRAEEFLLLEVDDKTEQLVRLLNVVSDCRQTIVLKGGEELYDERGYITGWLETLLLRIDTTYPVLAVVSSRKPRLSASTDDSRIAFSHLSSLSTGASKSLLQFAAFPDERPDPNINLDNMMDFVEGHPGLIHMAASAIRRKQFGAIDVQKRIQATVTERAALLVERFAFSVDEIRIISLVDELGALTISDLEIVFENGDKLDYLPLLTKLDGCGVLESWAGTVRIAPFLRRALIPSRNLPEIEQFLSRARKKLIEFVNRLGPDEGDNIGLLSAAIVASIRETGDFNSVLAPRPLVASRFLQVARRLYDSSDYRNSLDIATKAYELRIALSDEAQIEALRLRGLCAARLEDAEILEDAKDELLKIGTVKARRISKFMEGLASRLGGSFDIAASRFAEAYALDGDGDYHVLRERAFISLFEEDLDSAERFARAALRVAPTNAHAIDILLRVLIRRFESNRTSGAIILEIEDLMLLLKKFKSDADRFYELNEIRLEIAKRDYSQADKLLSQYSAARAITQTERMMLTMQLYMVQKHYSKALETHGALEKFVKNSRTGGRQMLVLAKALMVETLIASEVYPRAYDELKDAEVRLPRGLVKNLETSLADGIAHAKYSIDSRLKEWAKQVLGRA